MKLPQYVNLPAMENISDSSSDSSDSSVSSNSTTAQEERPTMPVNSNSSPIVEPHVGYKKVLVTGGAGFIGSHVAEYLLARGDDVVIIDEVNDYYDVRIKQTNLDLLRAAYPEEKRL